VQAESSTTITLGGTLLRHGEAHRGWVTIRGGRIVECGRGHPPDHATVHHGIIAPGLVDLQVNGAGADEVLGGHAACDAIERRLLEAGVTAYLPTIVSRPEAEAEAAVACLAERVADPGSPAIGIHLEGPLLSPDHAGAHDPSCLIGCDRCPPYVDHEAVAMVTLAPELPGALDVIRRLAARRVVVSLGHSGADAQTSKAAVDAGARAVTHLFNAMGPLHHREIGLAAAALTDDRITPTVIADGVHVSPLMLRLVTRIAGDRIVLVSDAVPSGEDGAGPATHAGQPLTRDGDRVTHPGGGLAGGAILLDEAVRRYRAAAPVTLAEAWTAASERPARLLGRLHGLAPGMPADLVLADRDGHVERVMRAGQWVA
jgi:N-acetylglucosamine-6-phosphate deacetylase